MQAEQGLLGLPVQHTGRPQPVSGYQDRRYQTEALEAIDRAWNGTLRAVLVSLPTGTGKTVIFSKIPSIVQGKVLVLAHRKELLDQARKKLLDANPHLVVEIEQAERKAAPDADVVIASVATIGRKGTPRIEKFDPSEFAAVVIDEAHHATADSYQRVLEHFDAHMGGELPLLGVTATPFRGDGTGLAKVFESIVYQRSMAEMMDEGWLCPLRAFRVKTDLEILDEVGTRGGDFVESQLANKVNTPERNVMAVEAWRELAPDRQRTLVFCADVAHVKDVTDLINSYGHRAGLVLGETDPDVREENFRAFEAGDLDVLVNCGVVTEGIDIPPIDCVLLLRPTKSPVLFTQMIGRGTRVDPRKEDLLVIDVLDNSKRHKVMSVASLFGLPHALNLEGREVREAKKVIDDFIEEFGENFPGAIEAVSEGIAKAERLRKLIEQRQARVNVEESAVSIFSRTRAATPYSAMSWVRMPDGSFHHAIPGEPLHVLLKQNLLDRWEARVMPEGKLLGEVPHEAEAFQRADGWMLRRYPKIGQISRRDASWRSKPATEKQLAKLRNSGQEPPEGLTAGAASDAIAKLQARRPISQKMAWRLRQLGHDPARHTFDSAKAIIARWAKQREDANG